jgi:hypothetical protein
VCLDMCWKVVFWTWLLNMGDGRLPACVGVGLGLQLFCVVFAGALRDGFQERAVTKGT